MSEEAAENVVPGSNQNSDSSEIAGYDAPGLVGIPGLGPARRAALEAADIRSRAEFARLTVEQVVSLTGMGRVPAARALDAVRGAPPVLPAVPEADDPLAPDAGAEPPTTAGVEDDAPTLPSELPPGRLDAVVLRFRTVASDLTRVVNAPQIIRPLVRLLLLLDELPAISGDITPKRRRRIANLLETLTDKTERAVLIVSPTGAIPPKRAERLRERFRSTRRAVAALVTGDAARPKSKRRKASGAGDAPGTSPNRRASEDQR